MTSAGVSYQVDPDDIRCSIKIEGWPFKYPTNQLWFYFSVTPRPDYTPHFHIKTNDPIGVDTLTLRAGETGDYVMANQIRLLKLADVDEGMPTPLDYDVDFLEGTTTFIMKFPHFNNSVAYDSAFSVSMTTNDDGHSESENSNLKLAAIAALVIIPLVGLIIGGVILGIMYVRKRRMVYKFTTDSDPNPLDVFSTINLMNCNFN